MTRLTNALKKTIINSAMKDIFSKREDADKQAQSEIFREIVDSRISVNQAVADNQYRGLKYKAAEANKTLGKDVLSVKVDKFDDYYLLTREVWRRKQDIYNYLTAEGKLVRDEEGRPKPVGFTRYGNCSSVICPDNVTPAQRKKLESYWLSCEQLDDDKSRLKSKIAACLESVTKVKKLIETYPDLEKYVPSLSKSSGIVLAVPPMELIAEISKAREGRASSARTRRNRSNNEPSK